MQKTVSQLDATGYYIGPTIADESPLEPGVWLIPAGAVDVDVPNIPDGYRAKWNGSGFDLEQIPIEPEPEPEEPPAEVPTAVTMRQARLALLAVGKLQAVEDAIDSLEEPYKTAAKIEWEYSQEVRRDKEFVQMLAPMIGLSESDLDDLFLLANTL